MNKLLLLSLLLSLHVYAQESSVVTSGTPVLTTEAPEEEQAFNPRKSHWITSFGFEGMKYQTNNNFQGEEGKFTPGETELWGGRLGLGGEIYLGGGFNTTTKVEGYYMGTLFSQVLNGGAEDVNVKFAYTKKTGQVYGLDASQSIGRLFNMKTKHPILEDWAYITVEPYIEAGFGVARAYNRLNYNYSLDTIDEGYRLRVTDELVNTKIALGINFTSSTGYFLYTKITQNQYDFNNRKATQVRRDNGSGSNVTTKPVLDDKLDPIITYAIGGGYKF